jgi:hypothetical protein
MSSFLNLYSFGDKSDLGESSHSRFPKYSSPVRVCQIIASVPGGADLHFNIARISNTISQILLLGMRLKY